MTILKLIVFVTVNFTLNTWVLFPEFPSKICVGFCTVLLFELLETSSKTHSYFSPAPAVLLVNATGNLVHG